MESTHLKARVICNPAASGGGYEPAVFAVIPRALKVIVGPRYVPEPAK